MAVRYFPNFSDSGTVTSSPVSDLTLFIWSSESSQMILARVKQAVSCHWTPSLYLLLNTTRQASSYHSCRPSTVIPLSLCTGNSVRETFAGGKVSNREVFVKDKTDEVSSRCER